MCRGKKMVACVTTGASADSCAANGKEGDTKMYLWPLLFPFRYIGFYVAEPLTLIDIGGVAFIAGTPKPTPLRKPLHHDGPTILSTSIMRPTYAIKKVILTKPAACDLMRSHFRPSSDIKKMTQPTKNLLAGQTLCPRQCIDV
tara:strand:- start:815 stop:1243 length:429 start_codon:yes stop_codon:yes gene_type:complete